MLAFGSLGCPGLVSVLVVAFVARLGIRSSLGLLSTRRHSRLVVFASASSWFVTDFHRPAPPILLEQHAMVPQLLYASNCVLAVFAFVEQTSMDPHEEAHSHPWHQAGGEGWGEGGGRGG